MWRREGKKDRLPIGREKRPEFYLVKSMLLLNRSVWGFSNYSEDFLLTDSKAVKQYLELFQKKLRQESNPYFHQELVGITEYLIVSVQYARRLRRERIKDYIKRAAIVTAVIICFVLFRIILDLRDRLTYTNVVISVGAFEEMAPINSVKLVDGITNPYITDDKRTGLLWLTPEERFDGLTFSPVSN